MKPGTRVRTHTDLGRPVYGTITLRVHRPNRPMSYRVRLDSGGTVTRTAEDVTVHCEPQPQWK